MMEFKDAEPVKVTGNGRKAEPNPFTEVIAAIALKTRTNAQGKVVPVAKEFILEHPKGERTKAVNKVRRQTTEAGAANDPKVTVRVDDKPVVNPVNKTESETKTVITFWTVQRQTRPRTAAPATGTPDATTNAPAAAAE